MPRRVSDDNSDPAVGRKEPMGPHAGDASAIDERSGAERATVATRGEMSPVEAIGIFDGIYRRDDLNELRAGERA